MFFERITRINEKYMHLILLEIKINNNGIYNASAENNNTNGKEVVEMI
jgi:hypothetical protein